MHSIRTSTALLLALTVACSAPEPASRYDFPRLGVSTDAVEFGEVGLHGAATRTVWLSNLGQLPMGLTALEMGTSDRSDPNFSVSWSLEELECPEGTETAEGALAVLHEGCRLPLQLTFTPAELGTLWGSLIVRTGTQELGEDSRDAPSYHADPLLSKRIVYLVGEGRLGVADVRVEPRRHDYGHLWEGSAGTATIAVRNTGDGELTLQEPTLDGCAESFAITALGSEGATSVLEPGISTFVEVTYTPTDSDPASCTLLIQSDDADSPLVEVDLEANTGVVSDNEPPTAVVRSPGPGFQWFGGEEDSLQVQINIFDLDQPADTLTCRIKSMVQAAGASVAHCDADDASGFVIVDVPYRYVGVGSDTIKVQVSDTSGVIGHASTTVLWNADYPPSDDDGDGWGDQADADEDGNYDCDDDSADTYPHAAELADGRDNDCDGVIDEGTPSYDDDGDSFSEEQGDCNDHDDEVYTGAHELPDYKDNDCDGVIDEGSSLYDDDGDAYTEMQRDCDDDDPEVHPGAVEYCDGIDNDCDGLRDYADDCIELYTDPYVVGGIDLAQTACEPGETIMVSVLAYDADGQVLDYAWSGDDGLIIEPLTGSPTVTITCPEPSNGIGDVLGLYVVVTDEDQKAVWVFDEIWVYPEGDLHRQYVGSGGA